MNDCCSVEAVDLQENGIVRNKDGDIIGHMGRSVSRDQILEAVIQAWCTPENEKKEIDSTLANQIITNVFNLF